MYQVPFRDAVLRLYDYFGSMRRTAAVMKISVSTIHRWSKERLPRCRARKPTKVTDAMIGCVSLFLRTTTRFSSKEVVGHVRSMLGIQISRQLAHLIIKRLGFTYKRTRKRGVCKKSPAQIQAFASAFNAAYCDGKLVAVDESGFDHRCNPCYGYAPRGKPAIVAYAPVSDRRRLSLLMAVKQDGTESHVVSPESVKGIHFASFVSDLPFGPGTVLLLDNASIHKTAAVKKAALDRNFELLYLPPYSPEFNPIELVFGVAKQHFYKSRYVDPCSWSLDTAVHESICHCANSESIQNCFSHAIYEISERLNYDQLKGLSGIEESSTAP